MLYVLPFAVVALVSSFKLRVRVLALSADLINLYLYCTHYYLFIVAQIAMHTGDYDTLPGLFCSETGLPDHAPFAAPMTV